MLDELDDGRPGGDPGPAASGSDDRPALARIVGQVPDFAERIWGREPLLIRAGAGFTDLLSEASVDELLSQRGLRTPFLRVAKDGTVGEWQHAGQGVQETRIPDNVLRITRHKARGIETEHPAVFPVALPDFLMRAYADEGDVVFEPFAGAGTTIIAAEMAGRACRAVELDPRYVDVAVRRWQAFAGGAAVLESDGRPFAAVAEERLAAAGV